MCQGHHQVLQHALLEQRHTHLGTYPLYGCTSLLVAPVHTLSVSKLSRRARSDLWAFILARVLSVAMIFGNDGIRAARSAAALARRPGAGHDN